MPLKHKASALASTLDCRRYSLHRLKPFVLFEVHQRFMYLLAIINVLLILKCFLASAHNFLMASSRIHVDYMADVA